MPIHFSPYHDFIRSIVEQWPGVTEKLCFDTPAFYVVGKLFARLKEDGETLVIHSRERDKWMKEDPETFFITDHYQNYKYMLINLGFVKKATLEELLLTAWKERANKKMLKELEEGEVK